eukprot:362342-Chlamydomonas_euryale.AAC.6
MEFATQLCPTARAGARRNEVGPRHCHLPSLSYYAWPSERARCRGVPAGRHLGRLQRPPRRSGGRRG